MEFPKDPPKGEGCAYQRHAPPTQAAGVILYLCPLFKKRLCLGCHGRKLATMYPTPDILRKYLSHIKTDQELCPGQFLLTLSLIFFCHIVGDIF